MGKFFSALTCVLLSVVHSFRHRRVRFVLWVSFLRRARQTLSQLSVGLYLWVALFWAHSADGGPHQLRVEGGGLVVAKRELGVALGELGCEAAQVGHLHPCICIVLYYIILQRR